MWHTLEKRLQEFFVGEKSEGVSKTISSDEQDKVEAETARSVGSVLVGIAGLCLAIARFWADDKPPIVGKFLGVLGLSSVLGAALCLDSVLDKRGYIFSDRVKLMSGGYLVFCLIVGGICFGLLVTIFQTHRSGSYPAWQFAGFGFTSFVVIARFMTKQYNGTWLLLALFCGVSSTVLLGGDDPPQAGEAAALPDGDGSPQATEAPEVVPALSPGDGPPPGRRSA